MTAVHEFCLSLFGWGVPETLVLFDQLRHPVWLLLQWKKICWPELRFWNGRPPRFASGMGGRPGAGCCAM